MRTIWFIRHGESEANAGKRTADPASIGLTEKGCEQAERIAQAFAEAPSLIVTSPYVRTRQTAMPTLLRFPEVCHEQWPVHEFTYLSPITVANTTLQERRPKVDAFWQCRDRFYVDGVGAESFAGFMERVGDVMERVRGYERCFIAVFSHEQFIRGVLWLLLSGSMEELADMRKFRRFLTAFSMPNGSILKVQLRDGEGVWLSGFITSHLS
jgi:broad specificity phosphatase PhoE